MIDINFFKNYEDINFDNLLIESFWEWLINTSWSIFLNSSWEKYFLQKLNTDVFSDVEALENNLEVVKKAIKNTDFKLIFPIKNIFWKMHTEFNWEVYRLYPFEEFWETHQIAPTNEHIFSASKKFAELSVILTDYFSEFRDTIVDFHNLEKRYNDFKNTLEKNIFKDRTEKSKDLIDFIEKNNFIIEKWKYYQEKIPKRVFHHDAKINNILFKKWSSEALVIVDLDTLMSGYIFSDFWDMVWTMVFGINHSSPKKVFFDEEKYNSLVSWYLDWFSWKLSNLEVEAMHFWGIYMSYMLSIRFLEDYLKWDKYFKVSYPEHNFDRAKYQLEIVKDLLKIF